MKIALGNLGVLTYAIKVSLEDLGLEPLVPPLNNVATLANGSEYMPVDMCFPLKMLLGNYLSIENFNQAEAVIFYSGCDMCNLTPVNQSFMDVFNELNWYPEPYYCEINSKKDFIMSYYNVLSKLSGKPWYKVAGSIALGLKIYEVFTYLDQVFYNIRPAFKNHRECKSIYDNLQKQLLIVSTSEEIDKINKNIEDLYRAYSPQVSKDAIHIGLVGDTYSLMEPFAHHYLDKQLGKLGVIVDRWSYHKVLPEYYHKIDVISDKSNNGIREIFKNRYGAFTKLELTKLSRYIARGYDGIVFIQPFCCNPNDALRNMLNKIESDMSVSILSLVFDEHTSPTGVQTRLESFVDILNKRKAVKYAKAASF